MIQCVIAVQPSHSAINNNNNTKQTISTCGAGIHIRQKTLHFFTPKIADFSMITQTVLGCSILISKELS